MEGTTGLLPFRFYSNQGVQSEQRQQGCQREEGHNLQAFRGWPNEREGKIQN